MLEVLRLCDNANNALTIILSNSYSDNYLGMYLVLMNNVNIVMIMWYKDMNLMLEN